MKMTAADKSTVAITCSKFSATTAHADGEAELFLDGMVVGTIVRAVDRSLMPGAAKNSRKCVGFRIYILTGSTWATDPCIVHATLTIVQDVAAGVLCARSAS